MTHCLRNFFVAVAALSAAATAFALDYDVTVKVAAVDGTKTYLYAESELVDSAAVAGGDARFVGRYPRRALATVIEPQSGKRMALVLDTVPISASLLTGDISGESTLNRGIGDLNRTMRQFVPEVERAIADNPSVSKEQIIDSLRLQVMSRLLDCVNANPDNGLGEYALINYSQACSTEQWNALYPSLSGYMRGLPWVKQRQAEAEAVARSAAGQPFIDFAAKNPDGTPARLSDYVGKGKYVVADFWASWCGPCRREGKETLKPLFDELKGNDKVVILGVAVWDETAKTLEAIDRSGYEWPQLIDADADATALYGIRGIPQIMLFGPDGTILARDLRGGAIAEELRRFNAMK